MGHYVKSNGSDLTIVTVVLQYSVFATLCNSFNQMKKRFISLGENIVTHPHSLEH